MTGIKSTAASPGLGHAARKEHHSGDYFTTAACP